MDARKLLLPSSAALLFIGLESTYLPASPEEQPVALPISLAQGSFNTCLREKFVTATEDSTVAGLEFPSGVARVAPVKKAITSLHPAPVSEGFLSDDLREQGLNTSLTWYLNGHSFKEAFMGEEGVDPKAFFTELGTQVVNQMTPEEEAPHRANWEKYCLGASDEAFARSTFLVGPAFGIDGVATCLEYEQRCGEF